MITDLFSHKIHSSSTEWPDKLVELAFLFSRFDGDVYDRNKIEKELLDISPRAVYSSRDPSKFRDEISAYPAYLGLYRLESSSNGWRIFLTDTAKYFLVKEEPEVASFMRLQLSLFQYPNGMGAVYTSHTNRIRIQANARDRTLNFISSRMHLSPLRFICKSLLVDSTLKEVPFYDAFLTFEEIFVLANSPNINGFVLPPDQAIKRKINSYRKGRSSAPHHFERRFHILKHTGLFEIERRGISFRKPVNKEDEIDLFSKVGAINQIKSQFEGFDKARSGHDLEKVIAGGQWGYYFDALRTVRGDIVNVLAADIVDKSMTSEPQEMPETDKSITIYPFKEREEFLAAPPPYNRKAELADPEVTRIKRQRRNLVHKLLIDKMTTHLKTIGATPMETLHIDLFAKIPNDGSFIFEMKSGGHNFLDQIRKGISQLYEYRFRYRNVLDDEPTLCLVLAGKPKGIPWLYEYICEDREICLCWFDEGDRLMAQDLCKKRMEVLSTE